MQIAFTVDNCSVNFKEACRDGDLPTAFKDLQNIANYNISDLVKQNSKLLVFPQALGDVRDRFGDSPICNLCGSADALDKAKIETGNVMGFVGSNDTDLRIRSRFATSDDTDYFLHYMLQRVFSINVVDFKVGKNDDSVFDFLLYLFPHFLKKAVVLGVYKEYQTQEKNDDRVHGPIDISRHIHYNIPFNGKIAYKTREYSYDNRITQLVRHTIEYIASTKQSAILSVDNDVKDCVAKIREATPSYSLRDRYSIVQKNGTPVRNPYFMEYNALQRLCVFILMHKRLKFDHEKNEVYGILFDGAWLWEEYLWTILKGHGFEHPENKERTGKWQLFSDNSYYPRYPDFFNDSQKFVLDAKYKRLAYINDKEKMSKSIPREDLHQLTAYLHISQFNKGGFAFPDADGAVNGYAHEIGTLNGFGGKIGIYGFPVPKGSECSDFAKFCDEMKTAEDIFVAAVQ